MDDGSTDQTGTITNNYIQFDKRFRYVRQENTGVSSARNKGIALAKGDFLTFLDSDDQYSEEFLQRMNDEITKHPDFDNFWCGFLCTSQDGEEKERHVWALDLKGTSVLNRAEIMEPRLNWLSASLCNKAFRREIVESSQIRMKEGLSLGEDLLFSYSYLDAASPEIVMINQPLYCYIKAENGSLNTKYRPDLKEIYDIIDSKILDYLQKWKVSKNQMELFYKEQFYHYDKVLRNTYRKENKASKREKKSINKTVMAEEAFQNALRYTMGDLNPLYRKAYQNKNWDKIRFLDKLAQIKKKLTR